MSMTFTQEQLDSMRALKETRPFMRVFGALSPTGEFQLIAAPTMHKANRLVREGWYVAEVSR